MRLVIVAAPADAAERASDGGRGWAQAPSVRRTASLTAFPSAFLPASFGITAFITLPMSFGEVAPVSAMAAATAASISSGDGRRRQVGLEHRDLAGLLVDEIGAAGLRELLDRVAPLLHERRHDLQHFGIVEVAALLDALVHDAALSIRSADRRAASLAFIAAVMSAR